MKLPVRSPERIHSRPIAAHRAGRFCEASSMASSQSLLPGGLKSLRPVVVKVPLRVLWPLLGLSYQALANAPELFVASTVSVRLEGMNAMMIEPRGRCPSSLHA